MHLVDNTTPDEELEIDEENDDDNDPLEEDESDIEDAPEEDTPQENTEAVWYQKARLIADHVSAVSRRLCVRPGSRLSIDEMMKLFKGRSGQTHRMKNKPIKEGYKFFAICDSQTGYVFEFLPNGRLQQMSTHDIILSLVGQLPIHQNINYVVAMDNYFTWSRVLTTLTDMGIGVVP